MYLAEWLSGLDSSSYAPLHFDWISGYNRCKIHPSVFAPCWLAVGHGETIPVRNFLQMELVFHISSSPL